MDPLAAEAAAYGFEPEEPELEVNDSVNEETDEAPETKEIPLERDGGPLREAMTRDDVKRVEAELPPEALRLLQDGYRGEWRDVIRGNPD